MDVIACQHDWPEILEHVRQKTRILACDGYVIFDSSRVPDERAIFAAWGVDVAKGVARGLEVPPAVAAGYEARVKARLEGDTGVHLNPPVLRNAKGKPFTWSFSAIGDFLTCPEQYAAKRYWETVKEVETEEQRWGTLVHKALELRVGDGTPLPEAMKQWDRYCQAFDALRAKGAEVHVERQVALNRCLGLVDWFAPTVWGRGVVDVLAVQGNTAIIADWKTGKKKDNQLQLDVFCAMTSILYPEVEIFKPRFIWLKDMESTGEDRTARDLPRIWQTIIGHTNRMEDAWRTKNFVARPSGLCRGWCPVTGCIHCKTKEKW